MMLTDKVAVIYGAGGGIGGAVARTFAREGAKVFLTGRHLPPVEIVAKQIVADGGSAEAAEVDALDEQAVDDHLRSVVEEAGRVDISFNAVGIPNAGILGTPLVDLDVERFFVPITSCRQVVLPDRTPGGPSDGGEPVGGDHDRHRHPRAGGAPAGGRVRPGAGRQGGAHSRPVGRARTSRHPCGRPTTSGDAGDTHDQGRLRAPRRGIGDDLGPVAGDAREQDPSATVDDARGDGERGRVHGVRSGERDDGDHRQPDDGTPRRLGRRANRFPCITLPPFLCPLGAARDPVEEWIGMIPDIHYARSGGVAVAYQVVGEGPTVMYAPPLHDQRPLACAVHASPPRQAYPEQAETVPAQPSRHRLVGPPAGRDAQSRMDDVIAIVEATDVDRIALFGVSESANVCALFASTYPERCDNLVLFMPYIMATRDPEEGVAWIREMREHWGERAWMEEFAYGINPEYGRDPELLDWFIWMQRAAASPESAAAFARTQVEADMREVLPAIKVPTLVLHRAHDRDDAQAFAEPITAPRSSRFPGTAMTRIPPPMRSRAQSFRGPDRRGPALCPRQCSPRCCSPISRIQRRPPLGSAIGHGASFSTNIMATSGVSWLDSGGSR